MDLFYQVCLITSWLLCIKPLELSSAVSVSYLTVWNGNKIDLGMGGLLFFFFSECFLLTNYAIQPQPLLLLFTKLLALPLTSSFTCPLIICIKSSIGNLYVLTLLFREKQSETLLLRIRGELNPSESIKIGSWICGWEMLSQDWLLSIIWNFSFHNI